MLPRLLQRLAHALLSLKALFSLQFYKRVGVFLKHFVLVWFWQTITFTLLLFIYLLNGSLMKVFSWRFFPKFIAQPGQKLVSGFYKKVVIFSTRQERTINRINLIDLAIKNMLFKRSRAMITVGGMAIGIGAIVFLVSIGFGLQELVISRVARLDELKQADISTQPGSKEVITDQTLSKIKDLNNVQAVLPMIAIVARVEFQNSVSDMAVYGVTADYLKQSAVQPVQGKLFEFNEIAYSGGSARVAGTSVTVKEYQEGEYDLDPSVELPIEFSLPAEKMVKVRSTASRTGTLVGYTQRGIGTQQGLRVWGDTYPEAGSMNLAYDGEEFSPWIKAEYPIWLAETCTGEAPSCIDGQYALASTETSEQLVATGFLALTNATIHTTLAPSDPVGQVLGLSTEEEDVLLAQAETTADTDEEVVADEEVSAGTSATAAGITEDANGWVEIASESAAITNEEITKVSLGQGAKRVAVVNRAMLQILNLPEDQALGKTFSASYVVVGDLLNKPGEKVESIPEEYQIVAVVPEERTPFFYVPFVDLRLMGITQYSQMKVVAEAADNLGDIRKQIESIGFSTRSVADTVSQIDRLFSTARIVLAILGFVALSIAALGMFNTLTVSLLERTREVGLMKAMGMKSNEVRELFLTESLVMGFFGGILGIILGYLASESLGLILSLFSVGKGIGFIDVAYLPASFVTFIFVLSLLVGVFTGIYPARRATKISALDALRYE